MQSGAFLSHGDAAGNLKVFSNRTFILFYKVALRYSIDYRMNRLNQNKQSAMKRAIGEESLSDESKQNEPNEKVDKILHREESDYIGEYLGGVGSKHSVDEDDDEYDLGVGKLSGVTAAAGG